MGQCVSRDYPGPYGFTRHYDAESLASSCNGSTKKYNPLWPPDQPGMLLLIDIPKYHRIGIANLGSQKLSIDVRIAASIGSIRSARLSNKQFEAAGYYSRHHNSGECLWRSFYQGVCALPILSSVFVL
ncbi:unnamed protein product [Pieris macdunnoughi]|uniref:Uncharacterized protein n=1 Tax=Pieris macdunnoughi TaxID=345717 RepID=A0A821PYS7_9NEOP|nr:unnamed protein product [Pieris macdunnoughi]